MDSITVSNAKPQLGRLVDRALKFQPVFIRRGRQVVQLVPAVMPDPIPYYPEGALTRSPERLAALMQTFTTDESEPRKR